MRRPYWPMLKITFSGAARRSPSLIRTARVRARAAAAVPQPSRMANANVSAVVISWVSRDRGKHGRERLDDDQADQQRPEHGGSCCTVATPPWLARNTREPNPTAETVST